MSTINVGINGLGRIGKCCFMQLFEDDNICIKAININNLEIKELEQYLNNDTIHGKRKYKVEYITGNVVRINQKVKNNSFTIVFREQIISLKVTRNKNTYCI